MANKQVLFKRGKKPQMWSWGWSWLAGQEWEGAPEVWNALLPSSEGKQNFPL